jgi:YbgC/YbaW family acyl-CoA thioester hydrolase
LGEGLAYARRLRVAWKLPSAPPKIADSMNTEPLKLADCRHRETLRIRWAEVDLQGIVFNGHYLTYFDTAIAGYWRSLALPYEDSMKRLGGDLYVKKATLEYHGSAHFDERCAVGVRCDRIGTSSMLMRMGLFRDHRLLVGGEMVYVFADPATQTSQPVPAVLRELVLDFEQGQPVAELGLGGWDEFGAEAGALRHAVFSVEQGIDAALDADGQDESALHALLRNRLGQAVGTARLLPAVDGLARLGRMAVHGRLRGAGQGRQMLHALLDAARERGDRIVALHAQASAVDFYRREGFVAEAAPFEEAGIEHQTMFIRLRD